MTDELLIADDSERTGHSLIEVLSWNLPGWSGEKPRKFLAWITDVLVGIHTNLLWN
jgi:hypothetical protein